MSIENKRLFGGRQRFSEFLTSCLESFKMNGSWAMSGFRYSVMTFEALVVNQFVEAMIGLTGTIVMLFRIVLGVSLWILGRILKYGATRLVVLKSLRNDRNWGFKLRKSSSNLTMNQSMKAMKLAQIISNS
jgi:hypothetical protein